MICINHAKGFARQRGDNNCSTFTQRMANTAMGGKQIDAKQTVNPNWVMRNVLGYKSADVIAPNNLYNAALKVKKAKQTA